MGKLSDKLKKPVETSLDYLANLSSGLSLKDAFLSLISIAIILMGVGHMVVTHDLFPARSYWDAEMEQALEEVRNSSTAITDDTSVADYLYHKVRIFCMVMSSRETLWSRAVHVNATWGRRCNKLVFMTDVSDPEFPEAVGIYTSTGRQFHTQKVFESLDYVYDHHFKGTDWFLKCDDDTYVIMENLRYFLHDKNPNEAAFFGQHFRNARRVHYFTGGAGYVMSKKSLRIFKKRDHPICKSTWEGANEDVRTSECLSHLGAKMGYSLDDLGRTRFHAFPPWTHISGGFPGWYKFRNVLGVRKGKDSMSPYAISFHKLESPESMYVLEYFVYSLRPIGVQFGPHFHGREHTYR